MTLAADPLLYLVPPTARSKITNARMSGKGQISMRSLLVKGDGRSPWARRYRDLVTLLVADAGGLACLSELKLALIRRVASLILECERLEVILANGGTVDIDLLARTSSHIRRMSETLGLNRVQRDATPSLKSIVAKHNSEKPAPPKKPIEILGPEEKARREKQRQSMLKYWARQKAQRTLSDGSP